jgi:hypothetical protein
MSRVEKEGAGFDEAATNEFLKTVLNDNKQPGKSKD